MYVTVCALVLAFAAFLQAVYVLTTGFHIFGPGRRSASRKPLGLVNRIWAAVFYAVPCVAILAIFVQYAARRHAPPLSSEAWLLRHKTELLIAICGAAGPGALLLLQPATALRLLMGTHEDGRPDEEMGLLIARIVGVFLLGMAIFILAIALRSQT